MYSGSVLQPNTWTEQTRQTQILNFIALQGMPQNRLAVQYVAIDVNVNSVALAQELSSGQLINISGEDAAGMPVNASDLWAKVAANGITGGTFAERNTIVGSIRNTTNIEIASTLIAGIITSEDLVITLTGGHDLTRLWFGILPAQYFANP